MLLPVLLVCGFAVALVVLAVRQLRLDAKGAALAAEIRAAPEFTPWGFWDVLGARVEAFGEKGGDVYPLRALLPLKAERVRVSIPDGALRRMGEACREASARMAAFGISLHDLNQRVAEMDEQLRWAMFTGDR